jgi:ABC-2 type transport system ATP-binding protein
MPPVLEFDGVSKSYRSFWGRAPVEALRNFFMAVEPGEIFGFLGPNGAGKSTAIHIALALLRPTSGRGTMLGRAFGNAQARRRVGFLAENVALYHRPVVKLLRFYGALNRMRDAELAKRTRELLESLDMQEYANRNAGKLSRGMLQRVGLAQALVNDPELVILDEPTSALDPLARVTVRELLLTLKQRGKTIFLSSHLLSEVEAVSDRVAILVQGKLAKVGRTAELLERQDEVQIMARNVSAERFHVQAAAKNGLVEIRVPAAAQRQAIERIWAEGGDVVSLNPMRKTLEQVFLELTSTEKSSST